MSNSDPRHLGRIRITFDALAKALQLPDATILKAHVPDAEPFELELLVEAKDMPAHCPLPGTHIRIYRPQYEETVLQKFVSWHTL